MEYREYRKNTKYREYTETKDRAEYRDNRENKDHRKQAGAELGQAQPKLGLELGLLKFIFVALNLRTRILIPT